MPACFSGNPGKKKSQFRKFSSSIITALTTVTDCNIYSFGRPRPGPARQIYFQRMGRGPAQPIRFKKIKNSRPGPTRPIILSRVSVRPGPAHHMAARPMRHERYRQYKQCGILAVTSHATAAAVLIPGSTSTHMKRRCNFRSEVSGSTSRSCTGGSVSGTYQGKNVMLRASPRRQGVSSVHPQRYQGFDPTYA